MFEIDGMTRAQKENLLAKLEMDLSRAKVEFTADELMLWDAACEAAANATGAPAAPIHVMVGPKKPISEKAYRQRAEYITSFMHRSCGRRLNRTERLHMAAIIFESLARYLRGWANQISAKTIMDNYESIPLAVDADYPMYAECELLGKLL